jgi:hypothetical protein
LSTLNYLFFLYTKKSIYSSFPDITLIIRHTSQYNSLYLHVEKTPLNNRYLLIVPHFTYQYIPFHNWIERDLRFEF